MPKDEFDFDDPFELNGVGMVCAEDTTDAMTECFVEEFMRLGHNHKQILALFRNPHYIGMNMALEKRGEQFVRDVISEVYAQRGRVVTWPERGAGTQPKAEPSEIRNAQGLETPATTNGEKTNATDPMGSPIPDLTI